jgi:hypothetical protein
MVFSAMFLPMPQLLQRTSAFNLNFSEFMPDTDCLSSCEIANALMQLMHSPLSYIILEIRLVPLNLRAYPSFSTHFDSSSAYRSLLGLHSGDRYVSSILLHALYYFRLGVLSWKKFATLNISREIVWSCRIIAWSWSVGCVVSNFGCSFRTTSFSLNCIGQRRHCFISGKYSVSCITRMKTFPDLGSSYAISAVMIGTLWMVPRDLINGVTLTWQSVLFIIVTPPPTQHVSALLSISKRNDCSFDACWMNPKDLSFSLIQHCVVWTLETVYLWSIPWALVFSFQCVAAEKTLPFLFLSKAIISDFL